MGWKGLAKSQGVEGPHDNGVCLPLQSPLLLPALSTPPPPAHSIPSPSPHPAARLPLYSRFFQQTFLPSQPTFVKCRSCCSGWTALLHPTPVSLVQACVHAQACPTLCNPMDCTYSAKVLLEWAAISSSGRSYPPRDRAVSPVCCTGRLILSGANSFPLTYAAFPVC